MLASSLPNDGISFLFFLWGFSGEVATSPPALFLKGALYVGTGLDLGAGGTDERSKRSDSKVQQEA